MDEKTLRAVRAMVKAYRELNAIRARDGVPWTRYGYASGVCPDYFSGVVDELDKVVLLLTGRGAHCHPELYTPCA